ncbi:MAG: hypothetical protein GY820_43645 [Gammaproteobacteria bacterium]|nr:hypothetical protein [Gammaproteobacteria bacterium]
MDATLNYTVKKGDGYLAIARYIFKQSHRPYIKNLTSRYDLMREVAKKIEMGLKQEYLNFKLEAGQTLKLHADPGHYIPSLSIYANHGSLKYQAKKNATSPPTSDNYFVIHSTVGNYSENKISDLKKNKPVGAGHAYITKNGEVIRIWPYNSSKGWATKVEKFKKKGLRGKMANIELIYGANEKPTEEQYKALVDVYLEVKKTFGKWLPIAAHREIDRGIPGGHEDPEGFKFRYFYELLEKKGVPIKTIQKQSPERFEQMPWCEHEWTWPPVLSGFSFKKLSRNEQIIKGCKAK